MQIDIKPRICQQKWQLEHHNVSNFYSSVPIISKIHGEICIFLFSLNQLGPKWHSKFYERNPELWESPNLERHPIDMYVCKINQTLNSNILSRNNCRNWSVRLKIWSYFWAQYFSSNTSKLFDSFVDLIGTFKKYLMAAFSLIPWVSWQRKLPQKRPSTHRQKVHFFAFSDLPTFVAYLYTHHIRVSLKLKFIFKVFSWKWALNNLFDLFWKLRPESVFQFGCLNLKPVCILSVV